MAKPKNTGLGRGIEAIFLDNTAEENGGVTMMRLSEIEPNPDQPRRDFDPEALSQLAESIATHGLIQPIIVRSTGSGEFYEIIAGERRWRASKMAGLTEVPVIIMELDDQKAAQVAIIENVQREDLNAIEEAAAYRSLIEDYGMTQEELSKQIGKSRPAVANILRLLELPDEVMALVKEGALSAGHARTLLGLKNPTRMIGAANTVVTKNLSVRETEALVKKLNRIEKEINDPKPVDDEPIVDYSKELAKKMTEKLGKKVIISGKGKQRKLEISFSDDKELDELVNKLCGANIFDD
ncbi:MAG: ParB/RepB/Spo0J family partition protein [Ruminococcaceae bacterium]|nr:ParB/RepB/Spo0J family partition protein [Oscillospiraceae bacterium]